MFQIKADITGLTGRMPSTSVGANNFGEIKNLSVTGPGSGIPGTAGSGSTSKFLANDAAVNNLWQAEGWKINDIYILNFQTGIEFNSTAKTQVHGCLFKNCNKGLFYTKGTTATNNTHYATQVSFTSCTTGVHLDSGHLSLVIADTSSVNTVIDQDGGRLKVSGGQIEGATRVVDLTDGKCIVENMRVLGYGSSVKIPFHASNRSAILVINVGIPSDSDAVIHLHDNTCSALGFPDLGIYRFSDIPNDEIYQVKLWNNELVHLSPFGIRPGVDSYSVDQDSRGFINYHVNEANDVGDDLRAVISSGISNVGGNDPYAKVSLIRKNNLTTTFQSLFQDMNGIEDHVFSEGTSTAARTVRLPRIAYTKATTNNSHSVTIIDKDGNASSNNITIEKNSGDTSASIRGSAIINVNFGSATFVTNGGDWYRIN
jgi:hypothetical protein